MKLDSHPAVSHDVLSRLEGALGRVIRGKSDVIRLAFAALFARGHLLIEDVPGVGKTTLARSLACSLGCSFQRIQFTSDMLPSDVIGVTVFSPQTQEFEFHPGPVFANIVLADEINRTTPKTQSALLEAMNETQVTANNHTYPLPQPFMVIATQNPVEHHGTFPLPESQLDRFLMKLAIGYPPEESEKEILHHASTPDPGMEPVITLEEVLEAQRAVSRVQVDEELVNYALALVQKTRQHESLSLGVSPRGSVSLYRAAQAAAYLDGRHYCLPDDFKNLAIPVLAHRCVVNSKHARSVREGSQAEAILREILEEVPVPL
ncbi:MAG: AAA family ATPase [Terriglobia bacterium]